MHCHHVMYWVKKSRTCRVWLMHVLSYNLIYWVKNLRICRIWLIHVLSCTLMYYYHVNYSLKKSRIYKSLPSSIMYSDACGVTTIYAKKCPSRVKQRVPIKLVLHKLSMGHTDTYQTPTCIKSKNLHYRCHETHSENFDERESATKHTRDTHTKDTVRRRSRTWECHETHIHTKDIFGNVSRTWGSQY